MADGTNITPGTGEVIATDEVTGITPTLSGTSKVQYVKLVDGTPDGLTKGVISSFGLVVDVNRIKGTTTAAITSVASTTSTTTLIALNASRVGATVFNDSTSNLYLACAASASLVTYTVKLASGSYYEIPAGYTGVVSGIWDAVNGSARITEFTP